MRNEVTDAMMEELEAHGLRGHIEPRGKHQMIVWEQDGKRRQCTAPNTPSDVRGVENNRHLIRKIIREAMPADETSNVVFLPQVHVDGDAALTNSRHVADAFDKRHDHVIRDINNLLKTLDSPDLGNRLFRPVMVADGSGISRRAYDMTKQGFMLLAMGFTGSKAIRFKLSFIDAFEALERVVLTGGMSDALANAAGRIAKLEGEIEAVTDLLLEAPQPAPMRKAQIIRPSLMRKLRRMA